MQFRNVIGQQIYTTRQDVHRKNSIQTILRSILTWVGIIVVAKINTKRIGTITIKLILRENCLNSSLIMNNCIFKTCLPCKVALYATPVVHMLFDFVAAIIPETAVPWLHIIIHTSLIWYQTSKKTICFQIRTYNKLFF